MNGCYGSFYTFVAQFATGTVECLLFVECGQYGEYNGYMPLRIQYRYTLRNRLAHIVKVWCFALYHTTDHNDSIHIGIFVDSTCGRISQFHCSRYMQENDVILIHPVFLQCVQGSLRHRIGDIRVPIRHYNCIALTFQNVSAWQYSRIIFRQIGSHYSAAIAIYFSISCASTEAG